MGQSSSFSCYLVGEGSLLLQCAELLVSRGHDVLGVLSDDRAVRRWAAAQEVPCLDSLAALEAALAERPCDYLFSIVNRHLLRGALLTLPRRFAVNYHDAPLPRYAGTHATSWAIMNGERTHGVSWHVVVDRVDAGDILKQRAVEVGEDDTAFSLNTKCYEAAMAAFRELVDELASGQVVARRQDETDRTFFARYKRPPAGAVIRWSEPAERIDAIVRALDFGPHPNPLGVARLQIRDRHLIVRRVAIGRPGVQGVPGTVVAIAPDGIEVATGTRTLIVRELSTLEGESVSLDALPAEGIVEGAVLPFPDDAAGAAIGSLVERLAKHEPFWERRLASGAPYMLPFSTPTVTTNPPAPIGSLEQTLPDDVLTSLAVMDGETREATIAASFAAYLYRIGRVAAFDVGYASPALHVHAAAATLLAPSVPVRVEAEGDTTFAELRDRLRSDVDGVELRGPFLRDLVFRYPSLGCGPATGGTSLPVGIAVVERLQDYVPESGGASAGELTLVVSRSEPRVRWVFDRRRVSEAVVARIREQFALLLAGAVAVPSARMRDLPLVPAGELEQLRGGWGESVPADLADDATLPGLFFEQARRTPGATALVFGDRTLTYADLAARAEALAAALRRKGVGRETLVGLCVGRTPEMIVGMLGIMSAGGAYVPLDPTYPRERLAFILEDTRSPVIVAQEQALSALPEHEAQLLVVDRVQPVGEPGPAAPALAANDGLAYLIYTSGSTGRPKGVAIEHRSAVAFVRWAHRVFTPAQLAGVLASTSMCFDLSVFEIFVPLTSGGAVVLADNALHLATLAAREHVTLVNTVPSAIAELVRSGAVPDSVKTVNLAGEPLKTELVNRIYEATAVEQVFDLYGPSEDTTYSTFTLRHPYEPATIGKPISNTRVYIVDAQLALVPIGVPGELLIGGAGLARGYLDRPELTAEKFIEAPLHLGGGRLYRTGDLARFRVDGDIEFLGRIDHQVKVRGFRVELGEVEATLLRHAGIADVVAMARPDATGVDQLVAYVVHKRGAVPTTLELRDFLKAKLPHYMVPSAFVVLDELPLTPNGKVDRRALPEPEFSRGASSGHYMPPRDDTERTLVGIWQDVLGITPIGVRDDYFQLGGHSLQAVRIFTRIQSELGRELSLATLFRHPTVEGLAGLLRDGARDDGWSCLVPIQPQGTRRPFFCMHARGGNVLFYRDLARHLGDDQPFYALQAQGLDGKRPRHGTLEEMAAHYIAEIRTVQPQGPYLLGGSSFGGTVAYEMAQQLVRGGEEVALLALFDTTGPGYPKPLPGATRLRTRMESLGQRVSYQWSAIRMLEGAERRKFITAKLDKARVKWKRSVRRWTMRIGGQLPAALRQRVMPTYVDKPWALVENEKNIAQALRNYVTRPYAGVVTLFRASKQPAGVLPDPTLGWGELAPGGLVTHEIPGYHGTIVAEPHVRLLAERLTECLADLAPARAPEPPANVPLSTTVGAAPAALR